MIEKLPNQNLQAEESLITALLINNELYYDLDELQPEHFYRTNHQLIYSAIKHLISTKQVADLVTVADLLTKRKQIDTIGIGTLAQITDSSPIVSNAKHYGDIVRKSFCVRNGTNSLMKLVDMGFSNPDPDEFITAVQKAVMNIDTAEKDTILSGKEIATRSFDRIEKALTDPDSAGLNLGFPDIDEIINVSGSKLILIAARPKVGKTAFMTSIISNMCRFGNTVGCLSLEMDESEITNRFIGELGDINPGRLNYSGDLKPGELNRIADAHGQISDWNIFIDDYGGNIEAVERKCRKLKKLGCQAIFIDQLSKIRGTGSATEVYSKNTSRLALLKKELRIPIFLLCQINREGTAKPTMRNLKQTGMLEEDADMIFILHREPNEDSETDCMLVAHRQGGTKDFKLDFTKIRITFNKVKIIKKENVQ